MFGKERLLPGDCGCNPEKKQRCDGQDEVNLVEAKRSFQDRRNSTDKVPRLKALPIGKRDRL